MLCKSISLLTAQKLIPPVDNAVLELAEIISFPLDAYSFEILHETPSHGSKGFCNVTTDFYPVTVPGDGNCLFNAVSFFLTGDMSLSAELRLRTAIEMLHNEAAYAEDAASSNALYDQVCPPFPEAFRDCCLLYSWSSIHTMRALANGASKTHCLPEPKHRWRNTRHNS